MSLFGKNKWTYLELKQEIAAVCSVALPGTVNGTFLVEFSETVGGRWSRLTPRQRFKVNGHYYNESVAMPFATADEFEQLMLCAHMNLDGMVAPVFGRFREFAESPRVAFLGQSDEASFLRKNITVSIRMINDWDLYPEHKLHKYRIFINLDAQCPKGSLDAARRNTKVKLDWHEPAHWEDAGRRAA